MLLRNHTVDQLKALPTEHSNSYSLSYAQHWEISVLMFYVITKLNILKT